MSDRAADQVQRMLALVPYLKDRAGVPVEQVARDFDVPAATVVRDLNVLWFCGLPEAVTGEMIDVDMDALDSEGVVRLDNADFLGRPLRLTVHEALALIVALRTLRETAAAGTTEAIDRALAKLESAAGDGAAAARQVQVVAAPMDARVGAAAQQALHEGRRVHLDYLVPSRDETTARDVDPLRLFSAEGHTYLEGWCYRAEGVRLFRLDRVVSLEVLDQPAAPPTQARSRDLSEGLFQPGDDDLMAVLDLAPSAIWIAEQHRVDSRVELADGWLRVQMRVADEDWLLHLVLRASGDVAVVQPTAIASRITATARAALAAYAVP
ncbi:MAG: WYL domain-containing protein [Actinomycetota bacterium]|nr:WYL domain-containing protein [Actinomycetota bacterium]